RRLPVRALWVVAAPPFRWRKRAIAGAVALAILPLGDVVGAAVSGDTIGALWALAATAGAVAAVYALVHLAASRALVAAYVCVVVALASLIWAVGIATDAVALSSSSVPMRIVIGVASLIKYFAVTFVLEE